MDKTININGKTWYAEQIVQSKDSAKLEHVLYVLQRELKTAKALYEENKSLGFTANMIEAEGCLRGLTYVNETIEWDLKEYFTEV
jgi:hypothetical protein